MENKNNIYTSAKSSENEEMPQYVHVNTFYQSLSVFHTLPEYTLTLSFSILTKKPFPLLPLFPHIPLPNPPPPLHPLFFFLIVGQRAKLILGDRCAIFLYFSTPKTVSRSPFNLQYAATTTKKIEISTITSSKCMIFSEKVQSQFSNLQNFSLLLYAVLTVLL